ncbi:ABC transporter substrate-binding protein [Caldisalinibacter kiritimatiensis]|uniref:Branched-chain amino acid ABC transporter, amino acid-binding protein n=1 Tax=Caldisalinibacter kiritimatiensis TaxID=1304284 RepID=R1CNQ4_9FIRM|nr:ABC transporter substrate-binding protein [Caldisalinibacter kiritimatiensis]EOD00331.1 Branched-chain amino acid ABC transporter, amino acid-binding protein [Caldisalinibacter kiritimatiensis]
MKKIVALLLSLLLVFSLVGCSTNQEGNTEVTDTANNEQEEAEENNIELAQGVKEDSIKIGTVGVQSGPLAFIGTPYFAGMEAYFNKVNDNGGVNGRKIELIKKDDEFNPAKSLQAVESLIYDEEVFAIVGHLGTPGVMAAVDTVKEAGIPSVYFGSGAVQLTQAGENFFPVQPNYVYEGKLMAKYAVEHFKANNLVVIYRNDDVGRDGLKGVEEGLKELGKSDILKSEGKLAYNSGDTDFTVQVQKAKSLNPDLIIIYGLSTGTAGVLKEIEKVGFDVPMLTTYSNADASFLAIAAPGAPNMIKNLHVMGWLDVTEESLKPLNEAMKKYFPDAPVNAYTMAGWVAAETFVAGLKEAGDNLSWEGYIEAMNHLNFTEGLAPEISYSPGVRQGVTKMAISKVAQDESGNFYFELVSEFNEFK